MVSSARCKLGNLHLEAGDLCLGDCSKLACLAENLALEFLGDADSAVRFPLTDPVGSSA